MDLLEPCPCDSGEKFGSCCQPLLQGSLQPATAEALMRSRYTAYVVRDQGYLLATWHPSTRPAHIHLQAEQRWLGLKVKSTLAGGENDDQGEVEFVARYKIAGRGHRLVERSHFVRLQGGWSYLRGE